MRKFKPTPAQEAVLSLHNGKHLVLAPPGSGKTELLALRVPAALERGMPPESMLCVTFTNRAARNMVARIGSLPGRRPFIGTLHTFALRFLFANSLIPANTVLLDEEDTEQMLSDALLSAREESRSAPSVKLPDVAAYIRCFNQARLELQGFATAQPDNPFLHRVALHYEQMKAGSCSIDFDDALQLVLHHLQKGTATRMAEFPWVQVDEVQDLSALQWAILGHLIPDDGHVVYFGDYDQAIFSFMGASHSALSANTKGATVHHLEHNYRSPPVLIDVFNAYASANLPSRKELTLLPAEDAGRTGGHVNTHSISGTFDDEARAIAVKIVPALLADHATAAVLTRTNKEAETVSQNLAERGIDHFKVSGFDLFRRRPIKDVMAFLRARQFPQDRHAWARLLAVFGGVESLRASRDLVSDLFDGGLSPSEWLSEREEISKVDQFADAFKKGRWIVFDTETTGLDQSADDIVQIAAMEIVDGLPTGREFEAFIETERSLDASAKVHGITAEFLARHGISPLKAIQQFEEFAGDAILAGHNVQFDLTILKANAERAGLSWNSTRRTFDTLGLARRLHPRLLSYKLGFLLKALKIDGANTHNALDDVRATGGLIRRLAADASSGQLRRAELAKQYRKYLTKFSKTLGPLWLHVAERLDEETNLSDVITQFFDHAVEHARYALTEADQEHVKTLIAYLEKNTPKRPIRKLLSSLVPELSTYSEGDLITGGEKLVVSTIHKAKGLQFEGVVVTSCIKDVYPHYYSKTPAAVEEDARLLYVAMTRAQQSLVMTMHDTVENRGGRFSRWPSPFLNFLQR